MRPTSINMKTWMERENFNGKMNINVNPWRNPEAEGHRATCDLLTVVWWVKEYSENIN